MVASISRLSAIRKASRWQRKGAKWHFHMLSPGCLFNPTKDHELFLESDHGSFVVKSHRKFFDIPLQLSRLLRRRITTPFRRSLPSEKVSRILARARHLSRKKIRWHHHLLFSHCLFNKKIGKWVIAFEDPLNNELIEIVYPHFPAKDLQKIEKLFYSQHQ
ncbi:hypothetical protein HY571_00825 [Candidatus Micrarchaeota archaeon]|nr:hypothetical protein [Candidatus Micrarchaeota archaeon]